MAGSLVTIAAEGILKKVLSVAAGELAIAWGYQEKLISLHGTLDLLRAKIRDAERQKGTEAVMVWLKQLKDVVGKADDVLDEVHYEMLRRHKIENINETLLKINTEANRLGLQNEQYPVGPVPDHLYRETIPHPEEFKIVGREVDELRIIELLTQSRMEEKLTVLPIVGMGGIGKTAFAKSIYNDKRIEQHFDVRAWLCVSVKVDIITLLTKIYESLAGKKPESDSKVNLIKSLEEKLGSKRYFLVLDDVWVEERPYWEEFRRCMIGVNSQNGSGILVTTRKLEIGTTGMKADSCHLKGLSHHHCWHIFRERAFVAGTSPSPELESIGHEIVKKCGGLPLLLNVIGGMLANYNNDKEKWLSIQNSKGKTGPTLDGFRLVQADEEKNKEMEDVGNDIFQNLVSNSLFQDDERDEYGHITRCRMHDMVKHLSFYQERKEDDEFKAKVSMFTERDTVARSLHTLFIRGEVEKKFSFQPLKCMRILKLKSCGIEKIDDSIGELVHLRYLNLSYNKIRVLPKSIGKLYHLQTLKLPRDLNQFPETMRNLISLRYFQCDKNIPANIVGQLTSLRTLPSFTVLRRKGHGIKELRHLNNLGGKLHIGGLENVRSKEDAVKANLSRKKRLYDIHFSWNVDDQGSSRVDKDVLEGLQPPQDVKILKIDSFCGDNFPEWVMKMAVNIDRKEMPLDKLVEIRLYGCRSCLSLPTLEHLPHLRDLVLERMDSLTYLRSSDVTGSSKPLSPSLRSLQLKHMKRLEKWIDGAPNSSIMISPVLESLEIRFCHKINLLDECHPHPLISLKIWGCIGLVSIKSIEGLTSLESLEIIMCRRLLEIINLPNQCHSLKTLTIMYCTNLTSLPHETFDCFSFLKRLELGPFSRELDSFPSLQGIEKLRDHLHSLYLDGWYHCELMPEEIQHLTSLTELTIRRFKIQELPIWLTNMSSIRYLRFNNCERLNNETVRQRAPQEAYVSLNYSRVYINRDVN
ncbi:unnamed protein product [Lactuca virosa]|uniref:Uncharacterized protein n=1 Tax=Lactuca virosa TaxID=75947 RepID=A0AAU9N966_9ASTR|nr:unnamed protein product [Lactuca virosa]